MSIIDRIDDLIAEAEKEPSWTATQALRCLRKELKEEQEPKKVADMADSVVESIEVGMCPSCSNAIVNHKNKPTRFCRYCGQSVTWE